MYDSVWLVSFGFLIGGFVDLLCLIVVFGGVAVYLRLRNFVGELSVGRVFGVGVWACVVCCWCSTVC